jgi:hypothetical protein
VVTCRRSPNKIWHRSKGERVLSDSRRSVLRGASWGIDPLAFRIVHQQLLKPPTVRSSHTDSRTNSMHGQLLLSISNHMLSTRSKCLGCWESNICQTIDILRQLFCYSSHISGKAVVLIYKNRECNVKVCNCLIEQQTNTAHGSSFLRFACWLLLFWVQRRVCDLNHRPSNHATGTNLPVLLCTQPYRIQRLAFDTLSPRCTAIVPPTMPRTRQLQSVPSFWHLAMPYLTC